MGSKKVKDLKQNPDNPRIVTEAKLAQLGESMDEYGDISGIIFNVRDGKLYGGNQRSTRFDKSSKVVITKKFSKPTRTGTIAVGYILHNGERFNYREVQWSAAKATGAMVAANKNAGIFNTDKLTSIFKELGSFDVDFNLNLTMFDSEELEELGIPGTVVSEHTRTGITGVDEDEVPEKAPARTKRGDVYQLGDHRFICGDATSKDDVALLMGEEKADMVFTDPPYNLASDSKLLAARGLRDSYDKLKESKWDHNFNFETTFPSLESVLSENSSIYICTSHFLFGTIQEWLLSWAKLTNFIVWAKPNPMPSLTKRHWTWASELICYGTKGKHTFNFPAGGHALNVWTINKNQCNDLHPTMKPVEVPEKAILHSSVTGNIVTDLFLGSGTTLIACEKTGRKCYGMEIDPSYCDIIVERWEKYTGRKAKLLTPRTITRKKAS